MRGARLGARFREHLHYVATSASPDVAVAAAVIIRIATLWSAIVLGFLALPSGLHHARLASGPV